MTNADSNVLFKVYFEECHYAAFGVVHRPTFEARLRSQFAQDDDFEDNLSWFALRNTAYASGCRVMLAKHASMTFSGAQAQVWQYFENDLSVHTELLYTPTGVSAVQALALMASICQIYFSAYSNSCAGLFCGRTRKPRAGAYNLLLRYKTSTVIKGSTDSLPSY